MLLNERLDETLESVGFVCDDGHTRNNLIIADAGSEPPKRDSPVKPELGTLCSKRITAVPDTKSSNTVYSKRITDSSPDGDRTPSDKICEMNPRRGITNVYLIFDVF